MNHKGCVALSRFESVCVALVSCFESVCVALVSCFESSCVALASCFELVCCLTLAGTFSLATSRVTVSTTDSDAENFALNLPLGGGFGARLLMKSAEL